MCVYVCVSLGIVSEVSLTCLENELRQLGGPGGPKPTVKFCTQADYAPSCRKVLQQVASCLGHAAADQLLCFFGDVKGLLPQHVQDIVAAGTKEQVTISQDRIWFVMCVCVV